MDRQQIGKDAEKYAEQFLKERRLKIIARNFSCRLGEIDLIMLDKNTLVFVEVRLRRNRNYGGAARSVTPSKQLKIIKTAQLFLQKNPQYNNNSCRFDVIAYEYDAAPSEPLWYKDAFRI
ncbi:YraN family protein [uncultured Neptuniibacter sp.]|uniref:YraN family protein n=1 Tax=uncultured Neptuniibacter sp. TaxID=502143 RepID=UPI002630254A|nr:YraN family protein [uncultured Neptuniibacter sp.]